MYIDFDNPIETYYRTKSEAYEAGRSAGLIFGLFIGVIAVVSIIMIK